MVRIFALATLALTLASCVTSTPYQPATGSAGYGFSEQRVEENKFRITFRGNSSTTREQVENSLLYRAAELTVQNGYDHFIVIENDTEGRTTVSRSASPAFFGRYPYGYPGSFYAFPYYAYGFGWEPYDTYEREYTRYSAVAFVTMHKGAKPADKPQAFDAREVMGNLAGAVLGPKPAAY
jgi:peptidoglycan/xylan/chitin deacetylase (PgdA/CDA1 family)